MNPLLKGRIEKYSPRIFDAGPLERDQLAYAPRFMVNAAMPNKLIDQNEWCRTINNHTYRYVSPSNIGLPGGVYSRFIFIWIVTQARITKSKDLYLGKSMREFMHAIGLKPTGGPKGNIAVFKDHFIRCINCIIYQSDQHGKTTTLSITPVVEVAAISNVNKWEWHATLRLSEPFFKDAMSSPPIDLGALLVLSPGTLRMDILNFLIARLYSVKHPTLIPWKQLYAMYASDSLRLKSFKQSYKNALSQAKAFYPRADVTLVDRGLVLSPSVKLIRTSKYLSTYPQT